MSEFRDGLAEGLHGLFCHLNDGQPCPNVEDHDREDADRLLASEPLRSLLAQRAAVEAFISMLALQVASAERGGVMNPRTSKRYVVRKLREALATEADR